MPSARPVESPLYLRRTLASNLSPLLLCQDLMLWSPLDRFQTTASRSRSSAASRWASCMWLRHCRMTGNNKDLCKCFHFLFFIFLRGGTRRNWIKKTCYVDRDPLFFFFPVFDAQELICSWDFKVKTWFLKHETLILGMCARNNLQFLSNHFIRNGREYTVRHLAYSTLFQQNVWLAQGRYIILRGHFNL